MKLSYFDVVDENDNPTGQVADYYEVHAKPLWHRGVHVVIYTPDRKFVMQKRAPSLKYHPDEIELSVGGGVDAGETPLQAGLREVKEELGLTLSTKDLRFINKSKSNHRYKGDYYCNFLYGYAACVPEEKLKLTFNEEETSQVFLLSERKLRRALRTHRIKHVGKITSTYAYWERLLDAIEPLNNS